MEHIAFAVRRHLPGFREARFDRRAARLELGERVVDRLIGIEGGAGGVELGVEILGGAFRAVDESLSRSRRGDEARGEEGGQEEGVGDAGVLDAIVTENVDSRISPAVKGRLGYSAGHGFLPVRSTLRFPNARLPW
jgi:hypothetical protein